MLIVYKVTELSVWQIFCKFFDGMMAKLPRPLLPNVIFSFFHFLIFSFFMGDIYKSAIIIFMHFTRNRKGLISILHKYDYNAPSGWCHVLLIELFQFYISTIIMSLLVFIQRILDNCSRESVFHHVLYRLCAPCWCRSQTAKASCDIVGNSWSGYLLVSSLQNLFVVFFKRQCSQISVKITLEQSVLNNTIFLKLRLCM